MDPFEGRVMGDFEKKSHFWNQVPLPLEKILRTGGDYFWKSCYNFFAFQSKFDNNQTNTDFSNM